MRNHALRKQSVKRFDRGIRQMSGFLDSGVLDTKIESMQNGVLDPADVLIDVHPVLGLSQVRWRFGVG